MPASFVIHSSGVVSPATVSAPAFLAVSVTVSSGDGSAHKVVVQTPTSHTLSVPARGHASVLLPGLKAGDYGIIVDGKPKAVLLIGGEPGP